LRRRIRRQQTQHLAIQVIDGGGKKQQRANRPAVLADGLADSLRIAGLVQINGITLLLDYGDDLSVSSEIKCVVEHRKNAINPRQSPVQLISVGTARTLES
jgi:hypothetical protein